MTPLNQKSSLVKINVFVPLEFRDIFTDWQAKLKATITPFSGFLSLEILPSSQPFTWMIVQRFQTIEQAVAWRASPEYHALIEELKCFIRDDGTKVAEDYAQASDLQGGVTEVFITQISPEKDSDYRKWIAKIHQVEAKFPGFQGVYVQAPIEGHNWITLLQFDTVENLDRWLFSSERQQLLEESQSLITSLDSHRVMSAYSGWFSSLHQSNVVPPVWKQTMIVLLVLFPIVMVELKWLSPLLAGLDASLATFIGNAISVTLISWPMMPIAIWFLGWWLLPKTDKYWLFSLAGTAIMLVLYLVEVVFFWGFLI